MRERALQLHRIKRLLLPVCFCNKNMRHDYLRSITGITASWRGSPSSEPMNCIPAAGANTTTRNDRGVSSRTQVTDGSSQLVKTSWYVVVEICTERSDICAQVEGAIMMPER